MLSKVFVSIPPIDFPLNIVFLSTEFESAHCFNVVIRAFHNTSIWGVHSNVCTVTNRVKRTTHNQSNRENRPISTTETNEWEKKWQTIVCLWSIQPHSICFKHTGKHTFSLSFSLPFDTYNGGLLVRCRYNPTLCTKSSILLLLIFFFSLGSRLSFEWACEEEYVWRNDDIVNNDDAVVDDDDDGDVFVCERVCVFHFFFGIWMSSRVAAWIFSVITVSWMLGS